MKFIVIGITDNPEPFFPPEVMAIIKQGKVFSGGRRHHDIVAPLLPKDAEWIDITVPLDAVFDNYQLSIIHYPLMPIIVFASGDPLFFGFANTLQREFPDAELRVFPTFNSLQMLAHQLVMPYHDMRIVSLTGRPWPAFDRALIERTPKIGILTDREHTPAAIAQRMLDYGYCDYTMYVGEHFGNPALEKVTMLTLDEAAQRDFAMPNCVIAVANCFQRLSSRLGQTSKLDGSRCSDNSSLFTLHSSLTFGIPDTNFALLDGREKMITKMPIRLLTLQALELPTKHVFWDIGFCTGSVSIEARLQFPHLEIHSFEIRPECETIIHENARRHGAPGIHVHMGDFLNYQLSARALLACYRRDARIINYQFPPDAVFIGGHGGRLKEIMAKVLTVLAPGGVIVMNSVKAPLVKTDSHQLWDEACRELGLQQEPPLHIQLNDHHPITILKLRY